MDYLEAFPPVQALGSTRLQALADEWLETPVAKECGVWRLVIKPDASGFEDVGLASPSVKPGELMHFPADNFARFVFDRIEDEEIRERLHAALNGLRLKVGVEVHQRYRARPRGVFPQSPA